MILKYIYFHVKKDYRYQKQNIRYNYINCSDTTLLIYNLLSCPMLLSENTFFSIESIINCILINIYYNKVHNFYNFYHIVFTYKELG